MHNIEVLPKAEKDIESAKARYKQTSTKLANDVLDELQNAFARISENPDQWRQLARGTHRVILRRSPYVVIYRVRRDVVRVIAVAHDKRHPDYWKGR